MTSGDPIGWAGRLAEDPFRGFGASELSFDGAGGVGLAGLEAFDCARVLPDLVGVCAIISESLLLKPANFGVLGVLGAIVKLCNGFTGRGEWERKLGARRRNLYALVVHFSKIRYQPYSLLSCKPFLCYYLATAIPCTILLPFSKTTPPFNNNAVICIVWRVHPRYIRTPNPKKKHLPASRHWASRSWDGSRTS